MVAGLGALGPGVVPAGRGDGGVFLRAGCLGGDGGTESWGPSSLDLFNFLGSREDPAVVADISFAAPLRVSLPVTRVSGRVE